LLRCYVLFGQRYRDRFQHQRRASYSEAEPTWWARSLQNRTKIAQFNA
jgi:hypothetical protein